LWSSTVIMLYALWRLSKLVTLAYCSLVCYRVCKRSEVWIKPSEDAELFISCGRQVFWSVVQLGRMVGNVIVECDRILEQELSAKTAEVDDDDTIAAIQGYLDGCFEARSFQGGQATIRPLKAKRVIRVRNVAAIAEYLILRIRLKLKKFDFLSAKGDEVASDGFSMTLDSRVNEKLMFHGTDPIAADLILKDRVRVLGKAKHGRLYGDGCYYAENPAKADTYVTPDNDGQRAIIISRVMLGRVYYCKDSESVNWDTFKIGAYDTVCGDRLDIQKHWSGFREFIVFNPNQAIPMYLVWCTYD